MFIPDRIFEDRFTKEIIEYDPNFSVKDFIKSKGGAIGEYLIHGMSGADLIENVCYNKKFSQRTILLSLEREFSGVTRKDVNDEWLNKSFGVGCFDNGTGGSTITEVNGFESQLQGAIKTYQRWYGEARVGEPFRVDEKRITLDIGEGKTIKKWFCYNTVIPQNAITFMFYKYTPHVGDRRSPFWDKYKEYGCYLTYIIGKKWFGWI